MKINVTSREASDVLALLTLAKSLGVAFNPNDNSHCSPDAFVKQYKGRFPCLEFKIKNNKHLFDSGHAYLNGELNYPEDTTKIVEYFTGDPMKYKVTGVGSYEAEITADGVIVGCQTISFEKVEEIAKKVAAFKKANPRAKKQVVRK